MAQTVDEIAEILNEMRVQNENNNESFEKILTGINTKLEMLSDENGTSDLLRVYISELKKAIEERHSKTLAKLENIETDFASVVKSDDFSGFRGDLAAFVQKIVDNSSALNSELSYNTEKIENILMTIRALDFKSDFENVVEKISDIKDLFANNSKINYDNLSAEISMLSGNLNQSFENLDNARKNAYTDLKEQLISILNNLKVVGEISEKNGNQSVEQILNSLNDVSSEISALVSSMNDNSDSNYQAIKNYVEELNDSVGKLQKEFNDVSLSNVEKIISEISGIKSDFALVKDEFRQSAISNVENSSKLADGLSEISNKLFGLEEAFNNGSKVNFETLKSMLDSLSEKLTKDFESQKELIDSKAGNDAQIEGMQKISDDIKAIDSAIYASTSTFGQTVKDNLADIKGYIMEMSSSISSTKLESDEKLYTKLANLDILGNTFEASVSSLNSGMKNVLDNILSISNVSADLKNKTDNVVGSLNGAIALLEEVSVKNKELISIISSVSESYAKSEDLSRLEGKVETNSNYLLENKNKLYEIDEKLSEIRPADYSFDIQQVLSKIDDLLVLFENTSNNNFTGLSRNFENIAGSINDIKLSFENNSKMNYENIINEIKNLKTEINSNLMSNNSVEAIEQINVSISDLLSNVQFLRDMSSQKYSEILENISAELNNTILRNNEIINSNSELNFGELKNRIDNISSMISAVENNFQETSKNNSNNIIENVKNLSGQIEELKNVLGQHEQVDRVLYAINEMTIKLEGMNENEDLNGKFLAIKDLITKLSADIEVSKNEYDETLKNNNELYSSHIHSVSDNIEILKTNVADAIENLKNYISDLDSFSKEKNIENRDQLSQKLFDIEASFLQTAQDYEHKIDTLQANLSEFAHIVEGSNNDVEGKIASSLDEIQIIKNELYGINEVVKSFRLGNDEKFNEVVSLLDASVENISFNVNALNDSLKSGVEASIKENLASIDEKFGEFSEILSNIKSVFSSDDIYRQVEDRLASMDEELKSVNSTITEALEAKSEEIVRAFEPIRISIDELSGFDLDKILTVLKSQIEASFMNFNVDLNSELVSNSEVLSRLENAYKESYNKIVEIEEYVQEKIQNDIELLNTSIESNTRAVRNIFEDVLNDKLDDLKNYIALDNSKQIETSNNINERLITGLSSIKSINDSVIEENNIILNNVSKILEKMSAFDTLYKSNELIKTDISGLDAKLDALAINTVLEDGIEVLNAKIDTLVEDKSVESSLNEINEKIDKLADNKLIENNFDVLNAKVDILAQNTFVEDSFNDINEKLNNISSFNVIEEVVNTLNAKVDTLAEDNTSDSILDEIDDIKNIIFEQRKFFEGATDERFSAIDKYLCDVLVKLDAVDVEKNAEDIKESILNALVSLVDQISFVEETEEIKDFVEEKTTEINKNIIEVQNQLKQMVTSDDAFDYSYTLQDVESDIARLRLAINNMTGNDFGDITAEIKKIDDSIENLKASLTQDEVSGLKNDIEKLSEDILSISSRTNKLLLNSDESYKILNESLDNFNKIIVGLEERINYLDNMQATERIEQKIDNIQTLASKSENADKVFNQAMMYLGEWVDSTTKDISNISDQTSKIEKIQENVEKISNQTEQINSVQKDIEEIRSLLPDKKEIIDRIENRFNIQDGRIDILENKIERIISTLEEKDDMLLNRKIDKIEKMLSLLGNNIEKLTSYVDEE